MADSPAVAERIITEDDLMRLPSDKRYEVWRGTLKETGMSAGFTHVTVTDNLFRLLDTPVRQQKLGRVRTDGLTCVLHEDKVNGIRIAYIPDFLFIRRGRIPKNFNYARPFPGAPDLAVEVVSSSDDPVEVLEKVKDYLKYGAEQVWVIYPRQQELHQYTTLPETPPRVYKADDMLTPDGLFPGVAFKIAALFVEEDEDEEA